MDTAFFQHYWWFIISLLGAFLVFLLFVQGGQSLLFKLGRTDIERTMLVNTLGRKWEFTFTTLVTFGGAFFASFPLFYSTSFGGAYWLWMSILFCFVIQAVSYEFRNKAGNLLGKTTYEVFLFINGLGVILLGVAVATFFTGAPFWVEKSNITNVAMPIISSWDNSWHGLDALANLQNLLFGFALFFLARTLALLYFMQTIDDETIRDRSHQALRINAPLFLVCFLAFLIWLLFSTGFEYNQDSKTMLAVPYKYTQNLLEMPVVAITFLCGVFLLLFGVVKNMLQKNWTKGIWWSGSGSILVVLAVLLLAGWNNTAYYPSTVDLQSSLTIFNSSASFFTLQVMSVISLLIPFVFWYIFKAWKAINSKPIDRFEMEEKGHKY